MQNTGVLREVKKPDDCPIMNTFVDLMLEKNIKSEDIFTICTGLRMTILKILWEEYPNFSSDTLSVQTILSVFDRNLAGVLSNFGRQSNTCRYEKQQEQYIKHLQTIFNVQDNIIFEVHQNKLSLANKALFLTTGVRDLKEFQANHAYPLTFIKKVDVFDSIFNAHEYDKWIESIIKKSDGECKVEIFNHILNERSLMQMKIASINDANDFLFTLTNITKMQKEITQLSDLIYKDSLTNLPNLKKFEIIIEEKLKNTDYKNFKILMIHLQGFKIIHEVNNGKNGEFILKSIAGVLNEFYPSEAARIDIDRFAILSDNISLHTGKNIIQRIKKILSHDPYGKNINVHSALLSLQEEDTKESILERSETLLDYVNDSNKKTIFDESVIFENEADRLKAENTFLTLMKEYFVRGKTVSVTSYYLQVSIRSDATIINVTANSMAVSLRKISLFSLYKNDCVFIEMPEKPHFQASVKSVDTTQNKVILENFIPVNSSPLDRQILHVKLQKPIDIIIESPKNQIVAELISVSLESFVIMIDHIYDIEIGMNLDMKTSLSKKRTPFIGDVYKIVPIANEFKLVVNLARTPSVHEELAPFISARQIEIIQELHRNVIE